MVSMSHNIDGIEYLTIAEAVTYMGCTDGWVRILLRTKKLRGKQIGQRLWLVTRESASEMRDNLTTRAKGKKHLAKRPAASRPKPKKAVRRKK
jgi:excisionase family DNA binding protein